MIKDFCSSLYNQSKTIRKIKSYLLASNLDKGEPWITNLEVYFEKYWEWDIKFYISDIKRLWKQSIQFRLINYC